MNTPNTFTKTLRSAIVALFSCIFLLSSAQTGEEMLAKLNDEDKESLKAMVIYPEETRNDIFIASQQPAALLKMKKIQEITADKFNEVIESKDRDTQRALWDLTRYPGLVKDIAAVGPRNESKLVKALEAHPEVIRARAIQMYDQQYSALSKINGLQEESDASFRKLMRDYLGDTKEAMERLLEKPEVLSLLTENMDLTVIIGDMYRGDPVGTQALATRMNEEVAEENARELNDWRESLEANPEASTEMQKASDEFTKEYIEDDVYYSDYDAELMSDDQKDRNNDRFHDEDEDPEVIVKEVHHYHHNYPYWFSYPRWYGYAVWRPFPRRFHSWSFGWGWGWNRWGPRPYWNSWYGWNWGMPSPYFMSWYYSYPYHFYRYPNLACQYSNFTYRNRSSINPVVRSTREWHRQNKDVLPARLDPSKASSVNAVREFGNMETSRAAHNAKNPNAQLTKEQFLSNSRSEYPLLAANSNTHRNNSMVSRGVNNTAQSSMPSKSRSQTSNDSRGSTGTTATPTRRGAEGSSATRTNSSSGGSTAASTRGRSSNSSANRGSSSKARSGSSADRSRSNSTKTRSQTTPSRQRTKKSSSSSGSRTSTRTSRPKTSVSRGSSSRSGGSESRSSSAKSSGSSSKGGSSSRGRR